MNNLAALNWRETVLVAGFFLTLLRLFWEIFRRRRLAKALIRSQEELRALKTQPDHLEYRIERFDVLWFPQLMVSHADKKVLQIIPGTPHCRSCISPLSTKDHTGVWRCSQCAKEFPASLVDIMVLDSIAKQAVEFFQERHPSYLLPKEFDRKISPRS